MSAIDDVARGEIEELKRTIRALQNQSPLERSSVSNGRLRFIGGELRIDSGGQLIIKGTLSVDGTSTVTGTFTVSGPWNLTGNGTITGATSITGNVTIAGKLVQNGLWELNGNGKIAGTVDVSGRVNVGTAMALAPSTDGGAVEFSSGKVSAQGGALGIYGPSGSQVVLNSSGPALAGSSGPILRVGPGGLTVTNLPTVSIGSVPGSFINAIVYWAGELRRVV